MTTAPSPRPLAAAELAAHLGAGGAALFPTDTLPALAARPAAAGLLWSRKARSFDKPLILMGADLDQLRQLLGLDWPAPWLEQAQACWPGAVTLVLPLPGPIAAALNPRGGSLGLRVPACEPARALLRLTGPLATTSANRSGEAPARDAREAALAFPDLPCLGPLPWPEGSGQASTVLAWEPQGAGAHGGPWRLLRAGATMPPSG